MVFLHALFFFGEESLEFLDNYLSVEEFPGHEKQAHVFLGFAPPFFWFHCTRPARLAPKTAGAEASSGFQAMTVGVGTWRWMAPEASGWHPSFTVGMESP